MTQAHTHTLAPTSLNTGLLEMRARNACRRLGLDPRDGPLPAKCVPAARTASASKQVPAPTQDAPDAPESMRDWRVCVLVKAGEQALTHVWVAVSAAGPRRASGQARAEARRAGHEPAGVCAVLRDDCPAAMLAIAV